MLASKLLLHLLNEIGEAVKGKTMFQKIVFILSSEFPEAHGLSDLSYTKYYYGPFSRKLESILEDAELRGFVQVTPRPVGDVVRYDISIAEEGKKALRSDTLSLEEATLIKRMAQRTKHLNSLSLDEVISEAYRTAGRQVVSRSS